jgi:hypothetical protein
VGGWMALALGQSRRGHGHRASERRAQGEGEQGTGQSRLRLRLRCFAVVSCYYERARTGRGRKLLAFIFQRAKGRAAAAGSIEAGKRGSEEAGLIKNGQRR